MKVIQTRNETRNFFFISYIFLTALMIKFGNQLAPEVMDFETFDIWNICSYEKLRFW